MANYLDYGYNRYFQRRSNAPTISENDLPDFTPSFLAASIDSLSASKIQGGIMQSADGRFTIDLENGKMTYNDGVVEILNLSEGNITIKNTDDTIILET